MTQRPITTESRLEALVDPAARVAPVAGRGYARLVALNGMFDRAVDGPTVESRCETGHADGWH